MAQAHAAEVRAERPHVVHEFPAPAQELTDLAVGIAHDDRCAIAHEGHAAHVRAERPHEVDGLADALEAYPRIEQPLDELELHEVLKGVETRPARSHCRL